MKYNCCKIQIEHQWILDKLNVSIRSLLLALAESQQLAIILDSQSLTYAEMLYYVQQVSLHFIDKYHVKSQQIICQCIERSIEMVIGILAISTTGYVYCPLSPNDPIERLYH
ncbi:unnamed protein product [Didymodactylos carnosus]|uniref:AMP-dependent synthetase/ligase domain-containing protein n=1 Tax=Didymodactylos carnosus TaxID=1234261 RepID=A0A8S2KYL7_9BILA|nr:unnamed protein product [Didymodactylos carnosus]CAF3875598.1 unnamed protein product [Didymodactylos carnosus]